MNLSGSLETFALPDVLSLLAATGKSGRLTLNRAAGGVAAHVDLVGGRITAATSDEARSQRLRRLSTFGDDQFWEQAPAFADETELITSLTAGGWVDQTALARINRDLAVDAVADLLRWDSGRFEFRVDVDVALDTELGVPDVLAEAASREEAPRPGPDAPAAASVLALPLSVAGELTISRAEWALLALIDGNRTTAEVAELRGGDRVQARADLASLISRGLVLECDPGRTPLAGLRRRLSLVGALEQRLRNGQAPVPETDPAPVGNALPASIPVLTEGDWTPSEELVDLAVPVDRDAVMRLIVGVQGL